MSIYHHYQNIVFPKKSRIRSRKYARIRELSRRSLVRPERSARKKKQKKRKSARERERERERRKKFILKWALPNGAARRTFRVRASWFERAAILAVCQGIVKGPEAARMNKKTVRGAYLSSRYLSRYDGVRTCVCARTRGWKHYGWARRSYARLFENHFRADRWGESILNARRHAAATPTSRYHCSAASKLCRVHRLHTLRPVASV